MPQNPAIPGLHHVTAICGSPQANADFYVGKLSQRLVKRTVNFDDPGTYHLYYGDEGGTPGSILTFFPFVGAGQGRPGAGMASAFAYAVPPGTLTDHGTSGAVDFERFGEQGLALADPDGLRVELIEDGAADRGGFHSVTLCVADPEPTIKLLGDVFGYALRGEERVAGPIEGTMTRMASPDGGRGSIVDILRPDVDPGGRPGAGTIHHVAFRAETAAIQLEWQERVRQAGADVTPVIDRQYFDAIYFREPGGILFEIATDPPGFATDEPAETMGSELMLPPRYEAHRERIARQLPPLDVPAWRGPHM